MSIQIDSKEALIAAITFSVMGVFAMMTGPIYIGSLMDHLQFDFAQASLILSVEYLGIALASICAAFWLNRLSWQVAAAIAVSVVIAGNIVSGMQTSPDVLAVIRFLVGFLGEGTAFVIGIAVISSTSDQQRNFGFVIASQVSFGVLAMLVLPKIIAQMGFGGIMYPLAGLALLFALAIKWMPSGGVAPDPAAAEAGAEKASAVPALIVLLAMFVWCTGLGSIWNFVERIAVEGGLTSENAAYAISVSTACAIAGGVIAASLGNRFGSLFPVAVALFVQMVMIYLLQGEMSWWQFAATAAVFQIFWNITGPFLMGAVAMNDPSGRISVMIPAAQIGGLFLGVAVTGQLIAEQGLGAANQVAIVCCIAALLIFAPIALKGSKQAA